MDNQEDGCRDFKGERGKLLIEIENIMKRKGLYNNQANEFENKIPDKTKATDYWGEKFKTMSIKRLKKLKRGFEKIR